MIFWPLQQVFALLPSLDRKETSVWN